MFTQAQKKSLELLKEFIQNTPAEQIKALKVKHSSSDIQGPTFAEYLHQLNSSAFIKLNKSAYSDVVKPSAEPPNKFKITTFNQDPTYCGVLFLHTFVK